MSTARWVALAVVAVVIACVSSTLAVGFIRGVQLQTYVGGWSPDGAKTDTFWNSDVVDVPGLSIAAVHCHGQVRYDLQLVATGPEHHNPCYALMNPGGSAMIQSAVGGVYLTLPFGDKILYRCSVNDGPWIYYIGDPIYDSATSPGTGPVIRPCPPS